MLFSVPLLLGQFDFSLFHLTLLIVLTLSVFFTMIGGMVGVILTDYVQSVMIFISLVVISILVLKVVGLESMKTSLETIRGESAFNFLSGKSLGLRFFIIFIAGSVTHRLAFPPALQKMAAAKSPEVVRKMFLLGTLFSAGRGMLIVVWGVAALALLGTVVPEGFTPESYHRVVGARMIRQITAGVPLVKGVALGRVCLRLHQHH